ncbi:hypothetical protein [Marinobacter sp.]|uniref:5'-methylthioadenosine/S-adenosylhomocysteine nucleosidase family protein n=1 Tax=Marinobacter sp. TaxID=50741 RepID=UPI003A90D30E
MRKSYKPGDTASSGYVIDEVLGESKIACVFTSTDNQIRWEYRANGGVPLEEHGAMILHFDLVLYKIKTLNLDLEKKKPLYLLAGKLLFSGLNGHVNTEPVVLFREVETEIEKNRTPSELAVDNFDLAIICALTDIELTSILNLTDWERMPVAKNDPQTYYRSKWKTMKGRELNVIVASPNHMGVSCSGVLAAKLIWKYKPNVVAMTGIAAGVRSDKQGFGDIIIADQTYDFGSSKVVDADGGSKIFPSSNPLATNSRALGILKEWKRERTNLDSIKKGWPALQPRTDLNIHVGPLFTSPLVLDSKSSIQSLMESSRKLAGIEMESHAVHRACNDTIEPPPIFLCLKAICDFAEDKVDDWQHYAAYVSAVLLKKFIEEEWESLSVNA